jgi:hypothetical protein
LRSILYLDKISLLNNQTLILKHSTAATVRTARTLANFAGWLAFNHFLAA